MEQVWIILLSRLGRALWSEMLEGSAVSNRSLWSRLARALWIEIKVISYTFPSLMSRLARALWIEILVRQS